VSIRVQRRRDRGMPYASLIRRPIQSFKRVRTSRLDTSSCLPPIVGIRNHLKDL
jgi:hypothetical protein